MQKIINIKTIAHPAPILAIYHAVKYGSCLHLFGQTVN